MIVYPGCTLWNTSITAYILLKQSCSAQQSVLAACLAALQVSLPNLKILLSFKTVNNRFFFVSSACHNTIWRIPSAGKDGCSSDTYRLSYKEVHPILLPYSGSYILPSHIQTTRHGHLTHTVSANSLSLSHTQPCTLTSPTAT